MYKRRTRDFFLLVFFLLSCLCQLEYAYSAPSVKLKKGDERPLLLQKESSAAYIIESSNNIRISSTDHVQCFLFRPSGYTVLEKVPVQNLVERADSLRFRLNQKRSKILFPFHFFL